MSSNTTGVILSRSPSVAVIGGGGVAGLVTIRQLLQLDFCAHIQAYEASDSIGGVWRASAYTNLTTNLSAHSMNISEYPLPADKYDQFLSSEVVLEYIESYAKHFDLCRYILFNCSVQKCEYNETRRKWHVVASDNTEAEYDCVFVCTGAYTYPKQLRFNGDHHFASNQIIHSQSYKSAENLKGKRVVVVGAGSSGVDIAGQAAIHAKECHWSIRRPVFLIQRYPSSSSSSSSSSRKPFDHGMTRFINHVLPESVLQRVAGKALQSRAVIPPPPPPPPSSSSSSSSTTTSTTTRPFHFGREKVTPDHETFALVQSHRIHVHNAIDHISTTRDVHFTNGDVVKDVELVIVCSGYTHQYPFLSPSLLTDTQFPGYRFVLHPYHSKSLAFIGVARVGGAALGVLEMQARWAAYVFRGDVRVPDQSTMLGEIAKHRHECVVNGYDDKLILNRMRYMDMLANDIACTPVWWQQPSIAVAILLLPFTDVQYRLRGPCIWHGAYDFLYQFQRRRSASLLLRVLFYVLALVVYLSGWPLVQQILSC